MKQLKILCLAALLGTSLMAYTDSDMDGVEDSIDKCPNTPLTDLVDINGCSKSSLIPKKSPHHFDILVGVSYTGANYVATPSTDTYSSSLQLDYYYKDFSLQASTAYYKTDASDGYSESGMNDSFVGMAYNFHPSKALSLRLGIGALLPTYDTILNNNNTDYVASLNASYTLKNFNIFAGYVYTQVNDDDVSVTLSDGTVYNYLYNNTNAYSGGVGYYFTSKFYLSGAYNQTQSIYSGVDDAKTLSAYAYYGIDTHWFMNFSYAYGLNDVASDHAASIKLGYYF
jgi:hypothetical protein